MRRQKAKNCDMSGNDASSSRSTPYIVQMTTLGRARNSIRPLTTPGCVGQNQCPCVSGSEDAGGTLTSAM
eukprot:2140659-Amphidinium_carterae.1